MQTSPMTGFAVAGEVAVTPPQHAGPHPGDAGSDRDGFCGGSARGSAPVTDEGRDREALLSELRDWLYDGNWAVMLADLTARLAGRPHLFDLSGPVPEEEVRARLVDDIACIARMMRR